MHRNSYFSASSYNYDNAIGFSDPDLLYEMEISAIGKYLRPFWAIFICERTELALFMFPVQNLLSSSFSATSISYKEMEIFAI